MFDFRQLIGEHIGALCVIVLVALSGAVLLRRIVEKRQRTGAG